MHCTAAPSDGFRPEIDRQCLDDIVRLNVSSSWSNRYPTAGHRDPKTRKDTRRAEVLLGHENAGQEVAQPTNGHRNATVSGAHFGKFGGEMEVRMRNVSPAMITQRPHASGHPDTCDAGAPSTNRLEGGIGNGESRDERRPT